MVDLLNGTIISYEEAKNRIITTALPIALPSFLVKLKYPENQFLISDHLSVPVIEWNRVSPPKKIRDTISVNEGPKYEKQNWDVAQASPQGRFLGGTFRGTICSNSSEPLARLYAYDLKYGIRSIYIPNLKSSGGIAWNANGDRVYHVSACEKVIREFRVNPKTGELCKYIYFSIMIHEYSVCIFFTFLANRRVIFKYSGNYGDSEQTVPLGLAIDKQNFLYVSLYYGSAVLKVNPE